MNPKARQELIGIAALLVGFFLGLTLLPIGLTGSWGRSIGATLWQWFGVGAIVIPVFGVIWALAAFDRLGALSWGRVAMLGAGLIILIPYGIAVAIGPAFSAADYENWTRTERLVGFVPGLLAKSVDGAIGPVGAVLEGLFALSALGILTVGWHTLTMLRHREKGDGRSEIVVPVPTTEARARGESGTGVLTGRRSRTGHASAVAADRRADSREGRHRHRGAQSHAAPGPRARSDRQRRVSPRRAHSAGRAGPQPGRR